MVVQRAQPIFLGLYLHKLASSFRHFIAIRVFKRQRKELSENISEDPRVVFSVSKYFDTLTEIKI